MKKVLNVFLVFIALFSIIGAVSATCSDDNQTIMRLYSGTNTHGARWDQTGYPITICYDTIFGAKYSSPTDPAPHDCTVDKSDWVIILTGLTNAHASSYLAVTSLYPISICHKGLINCSADCIGNGNKKPVVYLSSLSNAHLSNSALQGYFAICCNKNAGGGPVIVPPLKCEDYSNGYATYPGEDWCNGDGYPSLSPYNPYNAGQGDPGCSSISDKSVCHCSWDELEVTATKKCKFSAEGKKGDCNYRCIKTIKSEGACDDVTGMKTVDINAQIVPIPPSTAAQCASAGITDCNSGLVDVPCGLVFADLPFFGAWQFALSLVAVLLVYLLLNRKR